jgi:4-amino-4-deoxy-L-arabinose transferase-like glycosyltransferase
MRPDLGWIFQNRIAMPLGIAVAVYLLVFHRLADRGLWSSHEARAGLNAAWYLNNPGWGPSRLPDGGFELQKPPMSYWLIAMSAWSMGMPYPDSLAIRLPTALAALACAGCLVGLGATRGHVSRGVVAALMLLTMLHFTWLARIARTDMLLALSLTAGCSCMMQISLFSGWRRFGWASALMLATAFGCLTKGPLAPVLLVSVAMAIALIDRSGGIGGMAQRFVWPMASIVLGALICLPWFLLADIRTDGRFLEEFFWLHTWGRGLGGTRLREHPWWLYLVQGPFEALPWSPLLLAAAVWLLRSPPSNMVSEDKARRTDATIGMAWLVGIVAVLSMARFKRMDYLLPAFPAVAWVVACWWEDRQYRLTALLRQRFNWALAGAVALMVAGWTVRLEWFVYQADSWRDLRPMAVQLDHQLPADRVPVFFQLEQHELAYWLKRPIHTCIEWQDLAQVVDSDGACWVVTQRQRLHEGWFVDPGFQWTLLLDRTASDTTAYEGRSDLVVVTLERRRPPTSMVMAPCPPTPPSAP